MGDGKVWRVTLYVLSEILFLIPNIMKATGKYRIRESVKGFNIEAEFDERIWTPLEWFGIKTKPSPFWQRINKDGKPTYKQVGLNGDVGYSNGLPHKPFNVLRDAEAFLKKVTEGDKFHNYTPTQADHQARLRALKQELRQVNQELEKCKKEIISSSWYPLKLSGKGWDYFASERMRITNELDRITPNPY